MQGKLKTNDLIGKYLGDFPADKTGITIHHLLTHTAGLKLDAGDVGINPAIAPDEFLRKAKEARFFLLPAKNIATQIWATGCWRLLSKEFRV